MKKNKLLLITRDTIIENLKKENKESSITFLFPVRGFCVGFEHTYSLEEIKEEGFIFVNRIMDNEAIGQLKKMLEMLPTNIKGIVFDDIGVLNVLNKVNKDLTKILFLNHLNCNSKSIEAYLKYVDSVVISTDITNNEAKEILKASEKPLVIYAFGYVNIMYSRRNLLTNYYKHFEISGKKIVKLKEVMSNHEIKAVENEYGTVIYTGKPFNNLELMKEENVLYSIINTVFLTDEEVLEILDSSSNLENKYPYKYLSEEETIFKLKEKEQ